LVPKLGFQQLAIPEFDCDSDSDLYNRGIGCADKSVVKKQPKWRSILIDSRVHQTFAASPVTLALPQSEPTSHAV
jgi:hypothetical protein